MRRLGGGSLRHLTSFWRGPSRQSGKEALLLSLLVALTGAFVVVGVGLQLPSAGQSGGSRVQEVEALLTSIRQETARCTAALADQERPTQDDAPASADKRSHSNEDLGRKP
jgi:hypothetical protein